MKLPNYDSLKEWLPNPKSYLVLAGCITLGTSLFSFPEKALQLTGLAQTPQLEGTIRFLVPLLLVVFGLLTAHILTILFYRSSKNLKFWKFYKKITIDVGNYFEINDESGIYLKITVDKISKEKIPTYCNYHPSLESDNVESETATITFYPSQSYPGRCIKLVERNASNGAESFIMAKINGMEDDYSVHFFNVTYSTNGERIFRCYVDHINKIKQQVELNIYYLRVKNSQPPASL